MHKKSYYPKAGDLQEKWYLVDAEGQIAGRIASRVAGLLRGKDLPTFTPGVNHRVHVVVVNADKVILTGKKWTEKVYHRHSNWPGGLTTTAARDLEAKKPGEVLRKAVRGMLPKNRLGDALEKHLRVFAGSEHEHAAQQPEKIDLTVRAVASKPAAA
jgi:large subunit ribosomal protein L13